VICTKKYPSSPLPIVKLGGFKSDISKEGWGVVPSPGGSSGGGGIILTSKSSSSNMLPDTALILSLYSPSGISGFAYRVIV
jgi:hypothetical protein